MMLRRRKKHPFSVQHLEDRIAYMKENGVNMFGVVVTGPTKEILKLKDEQWVGGMKVGEVRLWNWHPYE